MMDVLSKLKSLAELSQGSLPPEWMKMESNTWHEPIRQMCKEAASEIERLRALNMDRITEHFK